VINCLSLLIFFLCEGVPQSKINPLVEIAVDISSHNRNGGRKKSRIHRIGSYAGFYAVKSPILSQTQKTSVEYKKMTTVFV